MSKYLGTKGRKDRLWRFSNPRLGVMVLLFAGAYRGPSRGNCMRTKPGADIRPDQALTSSVIHTLLEELTADELERVATAVIREHRCRLQKAQDLFEEIGRTETRGGQDKDLDHLQHDYRVAMLNLHAQHGIVSLVIEKLGYVPEVDGQRPILN